MFRSTFIALALFSTAFAGPTKRSNGLVVDVAGPAGPVSKSDELDFKATVKNTGPKVVKILKYNTILDGSLPTHSFVVTKDGEEAPFTGVKPYVSLSDVDDSAYVVIPPGESVVGPPRSLSSTCLYLDFRLPVLSRATPISLTLEMSLPESLRTVIEYFRMM
ncbi:hypothetical protein MPER_12267 [Moniliophthora perniciosa FA553]|nr:hypothetical protein MPER_12267 [Moniliophthora perniciosa FA553]